MSKAYGRTLETDIGFSLASGSTWQSGAAVAWPTGADVEPAPAPHAAASTSLETGAGPEPRWHS